MYIQNRRDSSKSKGCSPLQHRNGLISLKPAIAYFAYTQRYTQLLSAPIKHSANLKGHRSESRQSRFGYPFVK